MGGGEENKQTKEKEKYVALATANTLSVCLVVTGFFLPGWLFYHIKQAHGTQEVAYKKKEGGNFEVSV